MWMVSVCTNTQPHTYPHTHIARSYTGSTRLINFKLSAEKTTSSLSSMATTTTKVQQKKKLIFPFRQMKSHISSLSPSLPLSLSPLLLSSQLTIMHSTNLNIQSVYVFGDNSRQCREKIWIDTKCRPDHQFCLWKGMTYSEWRRNASTKINGWPREGTTEWMNEPMWERTKKEKRNNYKL